MVILDIGHFGKNDEVFKFGRRGRVGMLFGEGYGRLGKFHNIIK